MVVEEFTRCLQKIVFSTLFVLLILQTVQLCPMMNSMENQLKLEQVVPDVIDEVPPMEIEVTYPTVKVNQGSKLTPTESQSNPKVDYKAEPNELYTLAMVDPDAPSRREPKFREILHLLEVNIQGSQVGKGDILAEYIGPAPPKDSGYHRYVFLVYKQNERITSDMKIVSGTIAGRLSFSIRKFAKENNLGSPIAANFFQAQHNDLVPTSPQHSHS